MSVATTIELNDKVSKTLDSIISRLNKVDGKIEIMQNSFDKVDRAAGRAASGVKGFKEQQDKAAGGANKLALAWDKVGAAVKTAFAYFSAQKLMDLGQYALARANEGYRSQSALMRVTANMGGTEQDVIGINSAIEALSQHTSLDTTSLRRGAGELMTYLGDAEAVKALMPTFADYAAGMSGGEKIDAKQAEQFATQLGRVLVGSYGGISMKGFSLTDAQKETVENGTPMEKVAVLQEVIGESWKGLAETFAQLPENKILRLEQSFDNMMTSVGEGVYPAVIKLVDILNSVSPEKILAFTDTIIKGASYAINLFSLIAETSTGAANVIADNWDIVSTILIAIGMVALPAVLGGLWALVAPVVVFAASWLLPVAGVALFIHWLRHMGLSTGDVIDTCVQVIGFLYGAFYNSVASSWNIFAAFADFLVNVFEEPVASIIKLFADMSDIILNSLSFIAQAIDKIFGSNLSESLHDFNKKIQDMAKDKYGDKLKTTVSRMDYLTIEEGIDKTKGALDKITTLSKAFEFNFPGGDGKPDIGEVGEVKKVGGEINIAKEDLILLRDVAEARFIQNFVTMTPTVNMEVGNINNNMDEETMLDKITFAMENQVAETAEGVF